jgi:hypothetical protein
MIAWFTCTHVRNVHYSLIKRIEEDMWILKCLKLKKNKQTQNNLHPSTYFLDRKFSFVLTIIFIILVCKILHLAMKTTFKIPTFLSSCILIKSELSHFITTTDVAMNTANLNTMFSNKIRRLILCVTYANTFLVHIYIVL